MKNDFLNLKSDEIIIKQFRPLRRLRLKNNEWIKIPFSIIWSIGCFFMFWGGGFFDSFGYFGYALMFYFFLAGLYILLGRFILKLMELNFSEYVITNKRIIFYNRLFKRSKELFYEDITQIAAKEYSQGIGYLFFDDVVKTIQGGVDFKEQKYILENVKDYKEMEQLILDLKEKYDIPI